MLRNLVVFGSVLCSMWAMDPEDSGDVVKNMTYKFTEELISCMVELQVDVPDMEPVANDIRKYWEDDFLMSNYMTGCTITCLADRLGLLNDHGHLRHPMVKVFAMTQGADEELASQITELVLMCVDTTVTDECKRSLVAAQCVKQMMKERQMAPAADILNQENIVE